MVLLSVFCIIRHNRIFYMTKSPTLSFTDTRHLISRPIVRWQRPLVLLLSLFAPRWQGGPLIPFFTFDPYQASTTESTHTYPLIQ